MGVLLWPGRLRRGSWWGKQGCGGGGLRRGAAGGCHTLVVAGRGRGRPLMGFRDGHEDLIGMREITKLIRFRNVSD